MYDAYTYATRARDYRTEKYAQIFLEYQKQLVANNALDFDDMLVLAVKLLEQSETVREKYFKRFKHILVDEFQDTNLCQYKMINSIYTNNKDEEEIPSEKSLCVVGDVDQSIYSWRGADYRIILNHFQIWLFYIVQTHNQELLKKPVWQIMFRIKLLAV